MQHMTAEEELAYLKRLAIASPHAAAEHLRERGGPGDAAPATGREPKPLSEVFAARRAQMARAGMLARLFEQR